ncbi:sphingosine-1-phosphate phosphatase 2-like [Diadema antillarum]|uniref:sphingosine-1-phosphate phosphatase 2-like n=1 Tax=Diadema antillarum TaxID=105358 RepID=UPI003A891CB6
MGWWDGSRWLGSRWVYNAETVANIQLYFGLECVHENDCINGITANSQQRNNIAKGQGIRENGSDVSRRQVYGETVLSASSEEQHARGSPREVQLGKPTASLEIPVSYRVHNKFWYYLFAFGAALGDDIFYYTFYPFWFFNLSPWIIRRVALMWGLLMYIGQSSKEIIKWPRPSAPPVAPLERRYFREYGMPSTHAMVGTLVPFTILVVSWDKVEYSPIAGILLASSWTLLVCLSRLYKGMHYIMDIIVGIILTAILMFIVFQFLEQLDTFLITHPVAPLVSIVAALFLGTIYPTQDGWSSTRGDTIVIMGVTTGIYSSIWLAHHFDMPPPYTELPPPQIQWPGLYQVAAMMVRELIGVTMMGLAHLTFKTIILGLLSMISGQKITEETKKKAWVEIPYKYITYFAISATVFLISPFIFKFVGL